jgi:glycosyltransferase involved in cell wall biosynthesis
VPGRETLFEAIRSRANGIANLTFVERIPFEESQSWFERAKLLVGTSTAEGFPNTYIQACAAGAPIISLEVDPEQFIEMNDVGFAAHGDRKRLAETTARLLGQPEAWKKLSTNALAYVRKNHDVEVQGAHWAELMRRLANESRQGELLVRERELS